MINISLYVKITVYNVLGYNLTCMKSRQHIDFFDCCCSSQRLSYKSSKSAYKNSVVLQFSSKNHHVDAKPRIIPIVKNESLYFNNGKKYFLSSDKTRSVIELIGISFRLK